MFRKGNRQSLHTRHQLSVCVHLSLNTTYIQYKQRHLGKRLFSEGKTLGVINAGSLSRLIRSCVCKFLLSSWAHTRVKTIGAISGLFKKLAFQCVPQKLNWKPHSTILHFSIGGCFVGYVHVCLVGSNIKKQDSTACSAMQCWVILFVSLSSNLPRSSNSWNVE